MIYSVGEHFFSPSSRGRSSMELVGAYSVCASRYTYDRLF